MDNDVNVYVHFEGYDDFGVIFKKLNSLKELGDNIMSVISDFYAKQNEFNMKVDQSLEGLKGDIRSLNDLILKLQNSPGQISPEDQGLLDQLQGKSQELSDKAKVLDELTPPAIPMEEMK